MDCYAELILMEGDWPGVKIPGYRRAAAEGVNAHVRKRSNGSPGHLFIFFIPWFAK